MPARRFFSMLDSLRAIKAQEMIDQIDVQVIAISSHKYYQKLRKYYHKTVESYSLAYKTDKDFEAQNEKSDQEVREQMFSMFKKR
jgi:hypothetical protein